MRFAHLSHISVECVRGGSLPLGLHIGLSLGPFPIKSILLLANELQGVAPVLDSRDLCTAHSPAKVRLEISISLSCLQVRFVTEIALERRTVAMVSLPRHATPITSSKWCIASLDRPDAWPKATVSIEDAILNPPIFYTLRATQRGSQRAYGHRPMHFIESRVSHRWSSSSPTLRKHGTKVAGTIAAGKRRERRSTLPGAHACESHLRVVSKLMLVDRSCSQVFRASRRATPIGSTPRRRCTALTPVRRPHRSMTLAFRAVSAL